MRSREQEFRIPASGLFPSETLSLVLRTPAVRLDTYIPFLLRGNRERFNNVVGLHHRHTTFKHHTET